MKKFLFLVAYAALLISCGGNKVSQSQDQQDHLIMATLYVQHSAEYEVLCIQTYRLAYKALEELAQQGITEGAIVMDLDETVLDNSPYTAWQIRNNEPYTPKTWKKWVSGANADAVPGALEFIEKAENLGFKVYFISNREVDELEATLKNMRNLNAAVTQADRYLLKDKGSEKETRRSMVENNGNKIIMLIGDVLGDLNEAFDEGDNNVRKAYVKQQIEEFGTRYFLLPNPMYGAWEKFLFENQKIEAAQKQEARKNALKGADKFP